MATSLPKQIDCSTSTKFYQSVFQLWSQKLNKQLNLSGDGGGPSDSLQILTHKNQCNSKLNVIKSKILQSPHKERLNKPKEIHVTTKDLDQLLRIRQKCQIQNTNYSPKSYSVINKNNNNSSGPENVPQLNSSFFSKQNFLLASCENSLKDQALRDQSHGLPSI